MTLMSETIRPEQTSQASAAKSNMERRRHRRHDLEPQGLSVHRWQGPARAAADLGRVVDLSAGGIRLRTKKDGVRPDQQIRLRLELPTYAGIRPFVDTTGETVRPSNQWVGWLAVNRVESVDGEYEVAGRLMDMDDLDRAMLGLYLSTQPLAA